MRAIRRRVPSQTRRCQTRLGASRALLWATSISFAAMGARAQESETAATEDEELLRELEGAAAEDAKTLSETRTAAAPDEKKVAEEDLLARPADGAKEVIGNEANPSISIILDFAWAHFSAEDRLRQGGHAPTTNGPTIQGAELAASAPIDPYFRIDMAFGMWHLHMEEIYLTTTALPLNLQVRAGQFKTNIGRHNPTHLHTWKFVLHPLANEFLFGAEGLGPPGAELSYLFPLPWYLELIGAVQAGEQSGAFGSRFQEEPTFEDFIYSLRLVQFFDLSDDLALQAGLNSVFGPSAFGADVGNRSQAFGADLFFKWRPIGWGRSGYRYLALNAEGWLRQMEVPGDRWQDAGGYTDLILGLDKRWGAAARGELWRRLEGGAVDRENYGIDTVRGSASVGFMPSHFSRVRLQYTFEDVEGFDHNHIALLQLEVAAGAHGAHKY